MIVENVLLVNGRAIYFDAKVTEAQAEYAKVALCAEVVIDCRKVAKLDNSGLRKAVEAAVCANVVQENEPTKPEAKPEGVGEA